MAAVMGQWSHAGTSFLSLFFFTTMIIFMFYNIYFETYFNHTKQYYGDIYISLLKHHIAIIQYML